MQDMDNETIMEDVQTRNGIIRAATLDTENNFKSTEIPFYKPNMYPIILQKNISRFGQLLGVSDIDRIADQQNTVNRIERAMIDRLVTGGTYMSLPPLAEIEVDTKIGKKIVLENVADRSLIGTYDMQAEIGQHITYLQQIYEEARQAAGITDSYQGRKDPTASSGRAKEMMAQQAAERIESKKIMKQSAFSRIYELIFKLSLAYLDEPMDIIGHDPLGNTVSDVFTRYDFIGSAESGYKYDDNFVFSCDNSAVLSANRESMWQELSAQYSSGSLGDPADPATRILYWTLMGELHYPMADVVRARLEEAQKEAQMMAGMPGAMPGPETAPAGEEQITPEVMAAIDNLAKQNAQSI